MICVNDEFSLLIFFAGGVVMYAGTWLGIYVVDYIITRNQIRREAAMKKEAAE